MLINENSLASWQRTFWNCFRCKEYIQYCHRICRRRKSHHIGWLWCRDGFGTEDVCTCEGTQTSICKSYLFLQAGKPLHSLLFILFCVWGVFWWRWWFAVTALRAGWTVCSLLLYSVLTWEWGWIPWLVRNLGEAKLKNILCKKYSAFTHRKNKTNNGFWKMIKTPKNTPEVFLPWPLPHGWVDCICSSLRTWFAHLQRIAMHRCTHELPSFSIRKK